MSDAVDAKLDNIAVVYRNAHNNSSVQIQHRNKFKIGEFFELNWGYSGKVTGARCKTKITGGMFGGLKVEFPIGLTGFYIPGSGTISGQLQSNYNWLDNTIDRYGTINLVGVLGGKFKKGVGAFGIGGSLSLEVGGAIRVSYIVDSNQFDDLQVGVYARAYGDVGVLSYVSRIEYKWIS